MTESAERSAADRNEETDPRPPAATDDAPADETVRGGDPRAARLLDDDDLRRYARYGVLAMLPLVALVAAMNLYTSVSATIDLWVSDRYRPLYRAAFDLAVLLTAAVGLSVALRR